MLLCNHIHFVVILIGNRNFFRCTYGFLGDLDL